MSLTANAIYRWMRFGPVIRTASSSRSEESGSSAENKDLATIEKEREKKPPDHRAIIKLIDPAIKKRENSPKDEVQNTVAEYRLKKLSSYAAILESQLTYLDPDQVTQTSDAKVVEAKRVFVEVREEFRKARETAVAQKKKFEGIRDKDASQARKGALNGIIAIYDRIIAGAGSLPASILQKAAQYAQKDNFVMAGELLDVMETLDKEADEGVLENLPRLYMQADAAVKQNKPGAQALKDKVDGILKGIPDLKVKKLWDDESEVSWEDWKKGAKDKEYIEKKAPEVKERERVAKSTAEQIVEKLGEVKQGIEKLEAEKKRSGTVPADEKITPLEERLKKEIKPWLDANPTDVKYAEIETQFNELMGKIRNLRT